MRKEIVLVQHLDPSHESALAALLSRATPMPVREARNNLRLEPNHVYVIPPNKIIHLSKLVLEVIDSLTIKELEVQDHNGHWWSTRIRPYKTIDNKIEGAIIAFVDIELTKASAELASQNRIKNKPK